MWRSLTREAAACGWALGTQSSGMELRALFLSLN